MMKKIFKLLLIVFFITESKGINQVPTNKINNRNSGNSTKIKKVNPNKKSEAILENLNLFVHEQESILEKKKLEPNISLENEGQTLKSTQYIENLNYTESKENVNVGNPDINNFSIYSSYVSIEIANQEDKIVESLINVSQSLDENFDSILNQSCLHEPNFTLGVITNNFSVEFSNTEEKILEQIINASQSPNEDFNSILNQPYLNEPNFTLEVTTNNFSEHSLDVSVESPNPEEKIVEHITNVYQSSNESFDSILNQFYLNEPNFTLEVTTNNFSEHSLDVSIEVSNPEEKIVENFINTSQSLSENFDPILNQSCLNEPNFKPEVIDEKYIKLDLSLNYTIGNPEVDKPNERISLSVNNNDRIIITEKKDIEKLDKQNEFFNFDSYKVELIFLIPEKFELIFREYYSTIQMNYLYKTLFFLFLILLLFWILFPIKKRIEFEVVYKEDSFDKILIKSIEENYGSIKNLISQKESEGIQNFFDGQLNQIKNRLKNILQQETSFQTQIIDSHKEIWDLLEERKTPSSPPRRISLAIPNN